MKQLFLSAFISIIALKGVSQPSAGQLKITLLSAKCINKSWDGVVEFDGHGNEISVASSYLIYNAVTPSISKSGMDGTVIYGSNINGMTRAGTQTPDLGGITNSDEIQINKVLLNEHINANDNILFSPSLWEWDGPEKNTINNFNSQLQMDLISASNQNAPLEVSNVRSNARYEDRVLFCRDFVGYGRPEKYQNIFKNVICPLNTQGNRVIGIYASDCNVLYSPTLLVLNAIFLTEVFNNNKNIQTSNFHDRPNSISQTLTIAFKEETYAVTTSNGSYTIKLKVEFTPDEVVPNNSFQINKGNTPSKQNISIKNASDFKLFSVVGKWSGTQTNVDGLYPQAISCELTDKGEIIMANAQTGAIAAKGTYTYTNGNISGSYTFTGGTEAVLFTGAVNPSTLAMTLNMGAQGKSIMNKN